MDCGNSQDFLVRITPEPIISQPDFEHCSLVKWEFDGWLVWIQRFNTPVGWWLDCTTQNVPNPLTGNPYQSSRLVYLSLSCTYWLWKMGDPFINQPTKGKRTSIAPGLGDWLSGKFREKHPETLMLVYGHQGYVWCCLTCCLSKVVFPIEGL